MKHYYLLFTTILFLSCSSNIEIIDKPVIFDDEREALTLQYLSERYDIDNGTTEITPKMVVLHWTSIPTLEYTFKAFEKSRITSTRPDIKSSGNLNVSSQFVVDRDGTIYRLMPETKMARHVIGLNHCAIGIENVGGTKDTPLTEAQLKSNIKLVNYLASKYNIEYVIGHYEYTNFVDHELWLEKDDNYRTEKKDPGKKFVTNVRNGVKNLNLKPVPQK